MQPQSLVYTLCINYILQGTLACRVPKKKKNLYLSRKLLLGLKFWKPEKKKCPATPLMLTAVQQSGLTDLWWCYRFWFPLFQTPPPFKWPPELPNISVRHDEVKACWLYSRLETRGWCSSGADAQDCSRYFSVSCRAWNVNMCCLSLNRRFLRDVFELQHTPLGFKPSWNTSFSAVQLSFGHPRLKNALAAPSFAETAAVWTCCWETQHVIYCQVTVRKSVFLQHCRPRECQWTCKTWELHS